MESIKVILSLTDLYLISHLCRKIHLLTYTRPCCIHRGNSKKSNCFLHILLSGNIGPDIVV